MNPQTKSTIWSVIKYVALILYGLILPREILLACGSEMNGVLRSVSQFLSYTILFEFGICAVIPAALYRPLAEGNFRQISAVLSSGSRVFHKIAGACVVYTLLLALLFPRLSGVSDSLPLILVIGFGTLVRYAIGLPEEILVIADQKGYIVYRLQTAAIAISLVLQIMLLRSGKSLAIVQLAGTMISILQILTVWLYVRTHYSIDPKIRWTEEPIPQKWNGIAQHVAFFVLENTDIILLTIFTTFREVSVYSVYFMVISGIRRIFMAVSHSIQPKLGELKAKGDHHELNRFFGSFERWTHLAVAVSFGLMGLLLVPFVEAYTGGITDANYTRPVFAILLTVAYGIQSIRDVYDKLILASGHFRQTQKNYIIAAALNLGISAIAVPFWGLEGVASGTLVAMIYQLVYMAWYDTKVLLKRPIQVFLQNLLLDGTIIATLILLAQWIRLPAAEGFRWIFSLMR